MFHDNLTFKRTFINILIMMFSWPIMIFIMPKKYRSIIILNALLGYSLSIIIGLTLIGIYKVI
jgi:hypothetical protein